MTTAAPIFVFPSQMADIVAAGFHLSPEEKATLLTGEVGKFGCRIVLSPAIPPDLSQINATAARLGRRNLFAEVPYRTLAKLQGRAAC